jgi:hypothetical protein
MTYTTAEARAGLLDAMAQAIEPLALALACLGDVYEQLDERSAERMEDELFRPTQMAYGRAKRSHAEFAARHALAGQEFQASSSGMVVHEPKLLIERAVQATAQASQAIAELQDSMLPVEVGDAQLRSGLAEVRQLIDPLPARARELLRTLGR